MPPHGPQEVEPLAEYAVFDHAWVAHAAPLHSCKYRRLHAPATKNLSGPFALRGWSAFLFWVAATRFEPLLAATTAPFGAALLAPRNQTVSQLEVRLFQSLALPHVA